jgi:hypothetical protein
MQPIIFDHVNMVVVQVGTDPDSDRRYADLVAAQRPSAEGDPGTDE